MPSERTTIAIAIGLAVVFTFLAITPIYSYDFFWHLATGRWIAEHQALPIHDPFAIASDRTPWINGEWLFEVVLYSIGGLRAASLLRALLVGLTFAIAFFFAARTSNWRIAAVLTALAFAGAHARLDLRPSTIAAGLLVLAIVCATRETRAGDIAFLVVAIVWINVHPSALLAPVVAALLRTRLTIPSALALLVNPFGWRAVAAPITLTLFARGGTFVNAEWLPSPIVAFPLLYVCVVAGVVSFALHRRDLRRFVLFAILGYLAIAHVRNQGLFFAAFPLLCGPDILVWPAANRGEGQTGMSGPHIFIAVALIAFVLITGDHHAGVAPHRFPIGSVARLKATNFRGNIYNPDQFGGFLIWSFYPERRALTDGRNELFHTYIDEYAKARVDSRAWRALLAKYRIDVAVDEDRGTIDAVDAVTKQRRAIPASNAYWPPREWALIARDDVSMVFARRAAFPPEAVARWELPR